jgi:energy-converting hydrogenase Eha subunit F
MGPSAFRKGKDLHDNAHGPVSSASNSRPNSAQHSGRLADQLPDILTPGDLSASSHILPPLPALETVQSSLPSFPISTPPRHHKSSSSLYYAAAWGSPYATPSPRRSAEGEDNSSKVGRGCYRSERENWLSDDSENSGGHRRRVRGAERSAGSWLDLHSDDEQAARTPIARKSAIQQLGLPDRSLSPSLRRHHKGNDSLNTVKQVPMNRATKYGDSLQGTVTTPLYDSEIQDSMSYHDLSLRQASEKPPPHNPEEVASPSQSDLADASPRSKRRPSTTSGAMLQRPKKRVVWKGKACIIALPSDDERGRGGRPLLTRADIKARVERWESQGQDVRGFTLGGSPANEDLAGQTCSLYPDPVQVTKERQGGQFRVSVPNQAEWNAYVDFLKEEKLRALGVTLNDNDHTQSTRSPFPPNMSRASSRLPGQRPSPPVPTSSSASNIQYSNGRSFSPALHPSHSSSRVGSVASFLPQFAPPQNGTHRSEKSSAYSAMDSRITSPFRPQTLHPKSPFQREVSSSVYFAQRSTTLSPAGADISHQKHQRNGTGTSPLNHFPAHSMRPSEEQEILHPSPQGHHRNISHALQNEIDAAAEASERKARFDAPANRLPLNSADYNRHLERSSEPYSNTESRTTLNLQKQAAMPFTTIGESVISKNNESKSQSGQPSSNRLPHRIDHRILDMRNQENAMLSQRIKGLQGHRPTYSVSKLNVEAEEFKFNPKNQFSSSNFIFKGDVFQPSLSHNPPSYGVHNLEKPAISASVMNSTLNVDAPSFTPSGLLTGGGFQFNSAIFKADAPVFNPGRTVSQHILDQDVDMNAGAASAPDKIFNHVTIDPNVKATRRGKFSKAMPISQPDDGEHTEDDEDGRVRVSAARQKRARVQGHDREDSAQYAPGVPFEDGGVDLVSLASTSGVPGLVIKGNSEPVPTSAPDPPSILALEKADHKQPVAEDSSSEEGGPPLETQLSSQEDASSRQGDEEVANTSIPEEQSVPDDGCSPNEKGADYLSNHHMAASLSALPLGNAADDMSSDASSTTSKPRKSTAAEASHCGVTPPSSPPAATTNNEPLPLQVASESGKTSLFSEPAENFEADFEEQQPLVEDRATAAENTAPLLPSDIEDQAPSADLHSSISSSSAERNGTVPSYDEIDAVMKQLEDNSELGIERIDSPPLQSRPIGGLFLNPSINIRSEAPSPSPQRALITPEPAYDSKDRGVPLDQSPSGMDSERPGFNMDSMEGAYISDWNDTLSVADEAKFERSAQFFGTHVNSLVGGILDDRLAPLERTLETIQHSITLLAIRRRISTSDELEHSDADDEDEAAESGNIMVHQTRSPVSRKKEPRNDIVKTAVMEALEAYRQETSSAREINQSAIEQLLIEVRALKDSSTSKQGPDEIKAVVEEVISTHPRLRGNRVQEDHKAGASQKFGLQIDGLESLLKIANERTEEEYRARRRVEDDLAETQRRLDLVAEEAAQYREASEEAESSLRAYYEEKESIQELEQSYSEIILKNAALETTLEEYRLSHDQWRIDIDDERKRNKELKTVLHSLRREIEENSQTKQGLRAKLERLQDDMADVMERVAQDQASWVRKDHEQSAEKKELEAELHRETRVRQKMELELDELQKDHKEVLRFRDAHDLIQKENTRLQALLMQTQQESRRHEDAAYRLQREADQLREVAEAEASKAQATYDHEIRMMQSQHQSVTADLEGQVTCLHAELQRARDDAVEMKSNHQRRLDEQTDRHARALHEVEQTKEAALTDQRRSHEKAINDLRERHARALHNASDDKHRLDVHFKEQSVLSSDKIQHLEEKVTDLRDRLEITSSAAKAAVDAAAATAAAAGKATLESDNRFIPQSGAASMPLVGGLPEKISPQALRESIMVLQDQLQNREQSIEALEAELAKVDKDAPTKIKDRDTEITWLRELLGVRIDDLEEIIKALSEAEYDREAVKDAVIRLKANLEMEQQEKERAAQSMPGVFPTMASLSSLTQTPRALPMAAAAAWGNWRKARETSSGTLSELANPNDQTPSRSRANAPSFLSGLLTPPRTNQRQSTTPGSAPPPALKTTTPRSSSSEARPLRAYSSQARSMSARQAEKKPLRRQHSEHAYSIQQQEQQQQQQKAPVQPLVPSTPPLTRDSSYDRDADARRSIMSDLDDDASQVGSGLDGGGSSLGEPFDESAR